MGRASSRRRRAKTIRALQDAVGVDRDLAEHMHDRQIVPQELAAELRQGGKDVRTVGAWVGPGHEGFEVSCVGCGRTAVISQAPPKGRAVVCPVCVANGTVQLG